MTKGLNSSGSGFRSRRFVRGGESSCVPVQFSREDNLVLVSVPGNRFLRFSVPPLAPGKTVKALSCGGETVLGGMLGHNSGDGNWESKIVLRQLADNFCCETSICFAGPSGFSLQKSLAISCELSKNR